MRTLLVMSISIFTSRIILDILGIEDYGVYNVVGGFVSMFSVLSGTLIAASQRYLSYELGKKDSDIGKIFSTTLTIHFLLAIILFVLFESVGLWFVNCKMNIDPERLFAANIVFQCSVITFCVNLISIPYNAAIIAHEKMAAFAYISILEVVLKLLLVYVLYIITYDPLISYAFFMMIVALLLRAVYSLYCRFHFQGCKFSFTINKSVFKEILSFCGWNFIGSSAAVLNSQGINLLINLFFGVSLNAARGIASQVDNAINTFVQNFMMALNPQITKSYASGDYFYVNKMVIQGTKFTFFMFWILCLPVFINADFILSIWLKQVPDYAALFIRLGLIYNLCQNLSQCLYTTMLATGEIKKYQLIVGGISLLAFPTTYLFYHFGLPVEWSYWSMIIFSFVCLVARLFLLQKMVPQFCMISFIKKVIIPIVFVIVPLIICSMFIHNSFGTPCWKSFISESIIYISLSIIAIFIIGITKSERLYIYNIVNKRINK